MVFSYSVIDDKIIVFMSNRGIKMIPCPIVIGEKNTSF